MTESPPISFDQLREAVREAADQTLELALDAISAELSQGVLEFLGLAALKLEKLEIPELDDARIRITGVARLPVRRGKTADVWVEARFIRARAGLDYVLVFAPAAEALPLMLGDLRRALDLLPAGVEGLWCVLSSTALDTASLQIPGRVLTDVAIERGRSFLFRLKGALLKTLQLDKTVFHLTGLGAPLRFAAQTDATIRVGSLLSLQISGIAVNGAASITFSGKAAFRLFDGELVFDADLLLTNAGVALGIPIPQEFIAPYNRAFFQPLMFSNATLGLNGTVSNCSVSLYGDFRIKGSGHGGPFNVAYAAGNPSPIPDLFELEADRLTLSDAVTMMAGAPISLPDFLDRLVVLERTYAYCAVRSGLPTQAKVPSIAGAKAHSDIILLGYRGYGEFVVLADGAGGAKLLLAPIKFGRLIEIRGRASGSPPGYRGHRVGAKAIQFELDSQSRQAVASLEVAAFGLAAVGALAKIGDHAIRFDLEVSLPPPFGKTTFACALEHESIQLTTERRIEIGVDADWGYGRMKIAKAAQVVTDVKIVATPSGAKGEADVRASLGPVDFAFGLSFDPGRIQDLPELIRKAVIERALAELRNAGKWLLALADGTIAFVVDATEAATLIATELRDTFKVTASEAVVLLKSAGYEFNRAYMIVNHIQGVAIERVVHAMCGAAAYAEREAIEWLKTIYRVDEPRFTAYMVGEMLLSNGISPKTAIEEVQKLVTEVAAAVEVLGELERPVFEVVEFIRSGGADATKAAELLVRAFYGIDKAVVKQALVTGGYAVNAATQAAENIFRESGRFATNIRNEVRRTWRNFQRRLPRIKW